MSFTRTKRPNQQSGTQSLCSVASNSNYGSEGTTSAILKQLAMQMQYKNAPPPARNSVMKPQAQVLNQPINSARSSTAPLGAMRRQRNPAFQTQNPAQQRTDPYSLNSGRALPDKQAIINKTIEEVVLSVCRKSDQLALYCREMVIPIAQAKVSQAFDGLMKQNKDTTQTVIFMPRDLENLKVVVYKAALYKLRYEYALGDGMDKNSSMAKIVNQSRQNRAKRPETTYQEHTEGQITNVEHLIQQKLNPNTHTSLQGFYEFQNDKKLDAHINRLNYKDIQQHLNSQIAHKHVKLAHENMKDKSFMAEQQSQNTVHFKQVRENLKRYQSQARLNQSAVMAQTDLKQKTRELHQNQELLQEINDLNRPAILSVGHDERQKFQDKKEALKVNARMQEKQIKDKQVDYYMTRQNSINQDKEFFKKLGINGTRRPSEPNPRDSILNHWYTDDKARRPKIAQSATQAAALRQKSELVNQTNQKIAKTEAITNQLNAYKTYQYDVRTKENKKNLRNLNRQVMSDWHNQIEHKQKMMRDQIDINDMWQDKHTQNDNLDYLLDKVASVEARQKTILNGRDQRSQIERQKVQRLKHDCLDL